MKYRKRRGANLWQLAGILVLVIVVGLGLSWMIWSHSANRALFREIDTYRAAGEPVWLTDFARPKVPDSQNAAVEIRLAAEGLKEAGGEEWLAFNQMNAPELPLTAEETKTIRMVVEESQGRFAHVLAATTRPAVDWHLQLQTPAILIMLPHLNEVREVGTLLGADVLLKHEAHDDRMAMERIGQILFLSRATDQQPTFIAHLVAVGLSAMGADRCIELAPDLAIGTSGDVARPEQISRIIGELLDDRVYRQGQHEALLFERASEIDSVLGLLNGTLGGGNSSTPQGTPTGMFMRPMFLADARLMARHVTGLMRAVDQSDNLPAARRMAPVTPPEIDERPKMHLLASILLPSLGRSLETHYRGATDRHLAATALAIRWYAADHGGKLPAKLDDLVPAYLPSIPNDPMADGKPLRYLPREDRPVIYSVGVDAVDQGASTRAINKFPQKGTWDGEDAVVELKRQPRVVEPPDDQSKY